MKDEAGKSDGVSALIHRALLVVGLLLVLYLAIRLLGIAAPFILAWIAAYIFTPVVDFLERRLKVGRAAAVCVVMAVAGLLLVGAVGIAIPVVIEESATLATSLPTYKARILEAVDRWRAAGSVPPEIRVALEEGLEHLKAAVPEIAAFIGGHLFAWLGSLLGLFGFALDALIFLFVFFYFLRDFHLINVRLVQAVPERLRAPLQDFLGEISVNLRTVLRGQLTVALALVACYSIGLFLAGVPYAFLIGLVSGFGNFLPYVGPLLGILPALLFSALHAQGDAAMLLEQTVAVLAVFGVVQFLEGFILTPRLAGESVGLGPVAVLFAISIGGALFGVVGVLAALPAAAIVKVLARRGWAMYLASELYRGAGVNQGGAS